MVSRRRHGSSNATRPTLDDDVFSPLMNLAPELRNACYRSILVADEPVPLRRRDILARIRLLNTCTQIREEATSILWAQNTFIMDVRDIGPACLALPLAHLEHCPLITRLIVQFQVDVEPPVTYVPWYRRGSPQGRFQDVCKAGRHLALFLRGQGVRVEAVVPEKRIIAAVGSSTHRLCDGPLDKAISRFQKALRSY